MAPGKLYFAKQILLDLLVVVSRQEIKCGGVLFSVLQAGSDDLPSI